MELLLMLSFLYSARTYSNHSRQGHLQRKAHTRKMLVERVRQQTPVTAAAAEESLTGTLIIGLEDPSSPLLPSLSPLHSHSVHSAGGSDVHNRREHQAVLVDCRDVRCPEESLWEDTAC
jgi:hypothetical protein